MQIRRSSEDAVLVSACEGVSWPQSLKASRGAWGTTLPSKDRCPLLKLEEGTGDHCFSQLASLKILHITGGGGRAGSHRARVETHALPSPRAAETMRTGPPSQYSVLTLRELEGTEDLPLGCHPLDVGMIFKRQQPGSLLFFDLNHLEITRVVAGWIVSGYNSPVVDFTALQGA